MTDLSVCIPMYNESAVIEKTALVLHEYLEENYSGRYELIFCDDGSTDGSSGSVEKLGLPNIRIIRYEQNRGKGYAVRTALSESSGRFAFFTDADLAYGTDVIGQFYDTYLNDPGAGIIIGSRQLSDDGYRTYPLLRRVASKVYIKLLNIAGGLKVTDSQSGCKGFRRDFIDDIVPRCEVDRFAFDFEFLLWADKLGYRIHEVPVSMKKYGQSKVHVIRDSIEMLNDLKKMKKRIKNSNV